MTVLRRIQYFSEYLAVLAGRGLIHSLPLSAALWLARRMGAFAFLVLRRRRAIAIDNILRSGIATAPPDAARIARGSFQHFAMLMVETIVAERLIREDNWQEHIDISRVPDLLTLVQQPGQGAILTTAHFGNWEVVGQAFSYYKPVVAIARRMNNPFTDDLIQGRKLGHRFRMIMKHEVTGAALLAVLKQGEILAILIDQHARDRGIPVPFFGRPASTYTSAALLHLRSGAPLGFVSCVRLGPLRYQLHWRQIAHPVGAPRNHAAILAILTGINHALEDAIRAHPEQYLWGHRRWRLDTTPSAPPPPT
ncbi:MAG: hypothetical protein K8T26_19360 [Lentisphaerae bacterium]|nr:hypothetical protein [Lentisphaerota bacterium]